MEAAPDSSFQTLNIRIPSGTHDEESVSLFQDLPLNDGTELNPELLGLLKSQNRGEKSPERLSNGKYLKPLKL